MTNDLYSAICALTSVCDGARTDDTVGFAAPDVRRGHKLASLPPDRWSGQDKTWSYKILRKYRKQLAGHGIDFDSIEAPPDDQTLGTITLENNEYQITFPYNADLVNKIRAVPGRRWTGKIWTAPCTLEAREALSAIEELYFTEHAANAPLVASAPKQAQGKVIDFNGSSFVVKFPYDPDMVATVKTIPLAKWDKDGKQWTFPSDTRAISGLQERLIGFQWSDSARFEADSKTKKANANAVLSAASGVELNIDGLGVDPYPFQKAGILYTLANNGAIIGDEPGLGKTISALAVICAKQLYPALVVCPSSVAANWRQETIKCLPIGADQIICATNSTPKEDIEDALIVIVGQDSLADGEEPLPKGSKVPKRERPVILSKVANILHAIKFRCVVLDEAHGIKSDESQRSRAFFQLEDAIQPEMKISLTGTPVQNRPSEWINLLRRHNVLDTVFGGFIKFTVRYCNGHKGRYGWDCKGASNLDELAQILRETIYVRRKKKEVLKELPDKTRVFGSLPIDNHSEYASIKDDLFAHVKREAMRRCESDIKFQRSIEDLNDFEKQDAIREYCKKVAETSMKAEILVRMQKLESAAARGKIKSAIEWIDNFLESGQKLIVMAASKDLIKALVTHYKARGTAITADMSGDERLAAANRFRDDADCQVIICAMGKHASASPVIGLNLQAASNVAFMSIGWNPALHDQCEDRALRIGQKNAVTCHYLPAANTFECEKLWTAEGKRAVVDAATDGTAQLTDPDDETVRALIDEIF